MSIKQLLASICTVLLYLSLQLTAAEPDQSSSHTSSPTLLPDTAGRIGQVVISANSARRSALRNSELISNIVNALPVSTKVYIIVNDPQAFTVLHNPWPDRVQFIELPFSNAITIWPQDPFLVLHQPSAAHPITLLASKAFERAGDALMAEKIADAAGYTLKKSSLYFEGGNIVSDNEFVFIGANTVIYNARELQQSETDVALQFQQELGRPVMVIGPFPQPVAHIDMMLTPLGNHRVALADANAGAEIAEQALKNDAKSVAAFEQFCEKNFFGHPSIRTLPGSEGQKIAAPQLRGKTHEMIALSRQVAPVLDGIAASLKQHGYRVERIPFLYGGPESHNTVDEDTGMRATYPMLTYNNVLLEQHAGRRKVYLPRYGWPAMDLAAVDAWQKLGFEPQDIEGLAISAMYGGALRCSVKVLEKEIL
ncbi:MAG: agmatine deiminase family protein [Gammaproteobacteria bacterium]|nr:agmatine deiminase family protein [Gammaproteobacteria bacterium]